jgi:magnesium-transporting ATPase (P-type)
MKTKERLLREIQELTPEERKELIRELVKDEEVKKELRSAFMFSEFMPLGLLPDKDEKVDEKERYVAEVAVKRYVANIVWMAMFLIGFVVIAVVLFKMFYPVPNAKNIDERIKTALIVMFVILEVLFVLGLLITIFYNVIPELKILGMKGYLKKKGRR